MIWLGAQWLIGNQLYLCIVGGQVDVEDLCELDWGVWRGNPLEVVGNKPSRASIYVQP